MVTTERLKELFDYVDGNLIRKVVTGQSTKIGQKLGSKGRNDYRYGYIDGKSYPLHRLIWTWHGLPEAEELDHINRQRGDNRIENLRAATRSQNMYNKGVAKNNKSGIPGVFWKKDKQRYCVRLGVNGRRVHLGYFEDLELAELVSIEARDKYHGEFANIHA